ncbi:hypothetical protein KX729_17345, partial [Rhizobium sp. XQZ8]|nr:hypothetical protein [Rhizobium populisoli]
VVEELRRSCLTSHHRPILRKSMRRLNHDNAAPTTPSFSTESAQSRRHTNTPVSEPASFQTPLIARNIFGAHFRQTELSFLKFPADKDEALLFGVAQSFQTCAFGR